jgi:hypothetical protein
VIVGSAIPIRLPGGFLLAKDEAVLTSTRGFAPGGILSNPLERR